jgi:hypothetical protein
MSEKVLLIRLGIFLCILGALCTFIAIQSLLPGKKAFLNSLFIYAKEDFTATGWRFRQAAAYFGNAAIIVVFISFLLKK